MTFWGAITGGLLGTAMLSTTLRAASELQLTRIDLPFLLGSAFSARRTAAKALGWALHLVAGLLFALIYFMVFSVVGSSGWLLGALLGLTHGLFIAVVLVSVVLPFVHPRMGKPWTAADSTPLLEPPGFLMLNYGRSTPLVTLAAHGLYGAIVGGVIALS